jgi:hypothetical protein
VARGAVLHGLRHDATSFIYMRGCVRNYGVKVSQSFSAFRHLGQSSYQDPYDGHTKAKNQMVWLIKTGDLVLSDKGNYSSVEIGRKFKMEDNKYFSTILFASEHDEAPEGHLYNGVCFLCSHPMR